MNIEQEFDKFFEWPTDDKSTVSSVSAKLFAKHCVEQLEKENANLKSQLTLQQAANVACKHLPEGWRISLNMEKDAGYFELTNPNGDEIDPITFQGESLAEELNEMLNIANGFAEGIRNAQEDL